MHEVLPWICSQVARIYILIKREMVSFQFYLSLIMDQSRYKTNCDFETAIPHYIDGVGRKYIPRIGLRRYATPPNTEYIFSQLAVNIMRYCRLKIAISLYNYGIRGTPFKWFKSYLCNRTQYVKIVEVESVVWKLLHVEFPRVQPSDHCYFSLY